MPRLTVLFVLVLVAIIAAADLGYARSAFDLVRRVPGGDKIGHIVLIGALSFLVNASLGVRRTRVLGLRVLTGSLLVIAVMTLEEASQLVLPNRTASLPDLACNLAGVLVGGWCARGVVSTGSRRAVAARRIQETGGEPGPCPPASPTIDR